VAVLLVVALGVNAYRIAIIDPHKHDPNRNNTLATDNYTPLAEPEYPVFVSDYADYLSETGGIDYAKYYAPLEVEGNSKAFSITPLEGFAISAEENALDRDRDWNVREATADEAGPYVGSMLDNGMIPLKIYEVNAGLGDDEFFPGAFKMEFDIEMLGVSEEDIGFLEVIRVDRSGKATALVSEVKDEKLICESRQNSYIIPLVMIGGVLIGGALALKDLGLSDWGVKSDKYGDMKFLGLFDYKVKGADGKSYSIVGAIELPRDDKITKKRYTYYWNLQNNHVFTDEWSKISTGMDAAKVEAVAYADANKGSWSTFVWGRDGVVADRMQDILAYGQKQVYKDYRNARKNLKNNNKWIEKNCLGPEDIIAIDAIEAADAFLRDRLPEKNHPSIKIDAVMLDSLGGSSGLTTNTYLRAPYIQFSKKDIKNDGRENAFITVAHELLHVFQAYYVTVDWDSHLPVWEALARHFEEEIRDYYEYNNVINIGKDKLTNNKHFQFFAYGVDWYPGKMVMLKNAFEQVKSLVDAVFGVQWSNVTDYAAILQPYGYTEGGFITYLENIKGYTMPTANLHRGYMQNGSFRGAVMYSANISSKLTDAQFDEYFTEYCQSRIGDYYDSMTYARELYDTLGMKTIELSVKKQWEYTEYKAVNTSSFLQELKTTEGQYSWLIIKPDMTAYNPKFVLNPKGSGAQVGKDINPQAAIASAGRRIYIEGNNDPNVSAPGSTYVQLTTIFDDKKLDKLDTEIYLLPKPGAPGVNANTAGMLSVSILSEPSKALLDGYMDGYRVITETDSGAIRVFDVPTDEFRSSRWTQQFARNRITYAEGEVTVNVRVCEYMNTKYGPVTGPLSDAKEVALTEMKYEVQIRPPREITYDMPQGGGHVDHTFVADVKKAGGAGAGTYKYTWDFGDGSERKEETTAGESKQTHRYTKKGTFNAKVTLSLSNDDTVLSADTVTVTIKDPLGPDPTATPTDEAKPTPTPTPEPDDWTEDIEPVITQPLTPETTPTSEPADEPGQSGGSQWPEHFFGLRVPEPSFAKGRISKIESSGNSKMDFIVVRFENVTYNDYFVLKDIILALPDFGKPDIQEFPDYGGGIGGVTRYSSDMMVFGYYAYDAVDMNPNDGYPGEFFFYVGKNK